MSIFLVLPLLQVQCPLYLKLFLAIGHSACIKPFRVKIFTLYKKIIPQQFSNETEGVWTQM